MRPRRNVAVRACSLTLTLLAIALVSGCMTHLVASPQTSGDPGVRDFWQPTRNGTLYREATAAEIQANQWPEGTLLFIDEIKKAVANGLSVEELLRLNGNRLSLSIPQPEGDEENVQLSFVAKRGLTLHKFRFDREPFANGSPVLTFHRMFYRLYTGERDRRRRGRPTFGEEGRVIIDDQGNYYGKFSFEHPGVEIRTGLRTFQLLGPESGNFILAIPTPDGTIPGADDIATVFPSNTAGGNLDDLTVLPPANPVQLALFGNIMWCQEYLNNWPVLLFDTFHEIILGFRSSEEDTGVDIVVDGSAWCMVYDSDPADPQVAREEAKWCEWGQRANGETCDPQPPCQDSTGLEYPFTGDYRNSGKYVDHVWEVGGSGLGGVEYADHHLALPDLMLAQVLVKGGMIANADAPCPADDGPLSVCGQASTADPGGSVSFGRPSADYDPLMDGCGYTSAHELGHTLIQVTGHEVLQNDMGDQNCDGYETIMFGSDANGGPAPPDSCRVNWFSKDNADAIAECIADETDDCPRSGPYVDHLP